MTTASKAELLALADAVARAVHTGEEGAGTLPAKDSVKVRPADWHRVCDLARQASIALRALAENAE
ncbi:hypothetical protein [Novosphingopyxis sp. YJ-S2-01]|uniref:hypothetical protein n=1 Tax=Novosphingopyxis sp. YJ-S2-01 TaxID=2794021 RepID=UPI0018DE9F0D|nr:hypothetical protein [Novosphingopyxis sp. YJ-S2-01]MBH9537485.1 hypothetical protein [Novosphingopyxis sp. YJ-S2-01]